MKTKQKMLTKPITAGFASIFFILKVSKMGVYYTNTNDKRNFICSFAIA